MGTGSGAACTMQSGGRGGVLVCKPHQLRRCGFVCLVFFVLQTLGSHIYIFIYIIIYIPNEPASRVATEAASNHLLHYGAVKYFTEICLRFTEDKQLKKKKEKKSEKEREREINGSQFFYMYKRTSRRWRMDPTPRTHGLDLSARSGRFPEGGGVKSRLAIFHRTCRNTTLTEPSDEIFGVVR